MPKIRVILGARPVLKTLKIYFSRPFFLFAHFHISITYGSVAAMPTRFVFLGNFRRRLFSQVMLEKRVQQHR